MLADLTEPVWIDFDQHCSLPAYIDRYLKTRRIALTDEARGRVFACLDRYAGNRPLTTSNLDYFLDLNLARSA